MDTACPKCGQKIFDNGNMSVYVNDYWKTVMSTSDFHHGNKVRCNKCTHEWNY